MSEDYKMPIDQSLSFEPVPASSFTFQLGNAPEELLKLTKEGFFYKGKLITDDPEVYLKFKAWVDRAYSQLPHDSCEFNSIEERDNLLVLMQEALKFYAAERNYVPTSSRNLSEDRYLTMVEIDNGNQARFALEKYQELIDQNNKLQNDYNTIIAENLHAYFPETSLEDIESMVKSNNIISEQESLGNLAKNEKAGE